MIKLVIYGLVLSAIIGVISSIFLILLNSFIDFLWFDLSNTIKTSTIYTVLLSILGGLLVGYSRKKWRTSPKIAYDSIAELKTTQRADYSNVFIHLFIAFVILTFGASVGPAAALLSAVISLSIWQADKMRYFYFSSPTEDPQSWRTTLTKMALPHKYLIPYDSERAPKEKKLIVLKKLLIALFIVNGIAVFAFFIKITDQPPFVIKLGETSWGFEEVLLFIPLVLWGLLFYQLYKLIEKMMAKIFIKLNNKVILSALIGGAGIGLMSLLAPNLLFSGQLSFQSLPSLVPILSIATLALASILKLIFIEFCLKSGWIGGNILPVIFASVLQGFAIATFFPQLDTLFIVAVISSSASIAILKSPLLVGFSIMLFFPKELAPVILIIVVLFILMAKVSKKLSAKNSDLASA